MDGTFFSWEELRERADSLVNLENIVNLARDIEELIQIDEDDLNESRDKLLKAKTNLDILIRVLLTLLRRKFVVDKKIDTIVFHAFQENYGRIVMWLDKDVDFWEDHSYETINILRLKIMANKISEILYGDIYFPLDSAIEWEIENSRISSNCS